MHLLILIFLSPLTFAQEMRPWVDLQGREVQATFVRAAGEDVILRLADGRELPFPLAKLAAADRKYVADTLKPGRPKPIAGEDVLANFDAPWPDRVSFSEDPEIKIVEETAEKKRFVYESANYRYTCDVRLAASLVKGFAVMFEATRLYCRALPLALRSGKQVAGKYQIQLFEHTEDYVNAGGPPDTAGVFMSGTGIVMVPLTSLGVRPVGSGYMLDRDKSSKTIPHELTHQLTPDSYFEKGALGWFTEGIAEYIAATPYRSGGYNVRGNLDDIVEYATGYGTKNMGGRALGKKISLTGLKKFMLQDYRDFMENGQLNYGCGLLITTYFLTLDGEGDGKRIKSYLKALLDGNDAEKSLDLLLDGRSFKQLEDDITKAWSRKGIDWFFSDS